jgi:hypothetical protein
MRDFEAAKKDFSGRSFKTTRLRLIMKDIEEGDPNCIQYDPDECELDLSL